MTRWQSSLYKVSTVATTTNKHLPLVVHRSKRLTYFAVVVRGLLRGRTNGLGRGDVQTDETNRRTRWLIRQRPRRFQNKKRSRMNSVPAERQTFRNRRYLIIGRRRSYDDATTVAVGDPRGLLWRSTTKYAPPATVNGERSHTRTASIFVCRPGAFILWKRYNSDVRTAQLLDSTT